MLVEVERVQTDAAVSQEKLDVRIQIDGCVHNGPSGLLRERRNIGPAAGKVDAQRCPRSERHGAPPFP